MAIDSYPKPALPVKVNIGGVDAEVLYYGAAPFLVVGAMQVNARVPAGIAPGAAPLVLSVGGFDSRSGVTLAVQ